MSNCPSKLPFSLGVTSYVQPYALLPNIEFITSKKQFDNIEILFFESHKLSPLPDDAAITRLSELSEEYGVSYTVHLPLDLNLGVIGSAKENIDKLMTIWDRVKGLDVSGYILHCSKSHTNDLDKWRAIISEEISNFLSVSGMPRRLLCVENIDYPFSWVYPVIEELSLSVCMDTGHLFLAGENPITFYEKYADRIKVCHLHGAAEGRDHKSLKYFPQNMLLCLLDKIKFSDITVTLEMFSWNRVIESMVILEEYRGRNV